MLGHPLCFDQIRTHHALWKDQIHYALDSGRPTGSSTKHLGDAATEQIPARLVDPDVERRLSWKIDRRMIPMVMWMYLMSFMDRVNIGNARLYNLEEDLGMDKVGQGYSLAVSVLFIPYCLLETPSNMILKQCRPRFYLAFVVLPWGLVATFRAFVQNLAGLIICRLLLGVFEAGLFPGLVVYLTIFYNKSNIGLRTALLFATSAFSGAAGGLVSFAIGYMDGVGGWSAWRWIFAINGIATVLTAFVVPFVLSDSPQTAKYPTNEDRSNIALLREAEVGQTASAQQFDIADAKEAFKDWTVWVYGSAQYCQNTMLYSFSIFLPTIIRGIGQWSVAEVQCLTIPVIQVRGPFIIGGTLVSIIGYVMLIASSSVRVSFAGTFVTSAGLFLCVGLPLSWLSSNNPRYGKLTTASGIQVTLANLSGVGAPFLYPRADGPRYFIGYGEEDYWQGGLEVEGKTEQEAREMGERNPAFLFVT
ncbi:Putative major facilitator superfamily, MFS transporter superfamily [Septoria linicola]|uniref:Major facilitator superfamily, MFS transporter superfamily n=1 Tax=Septoria linicola TaxID=215465 RepID=A0A9Q9EIG8_9PEZI|nr:Putative major facilitator superfamily, MFS transporter superfamily [Septoria linicola]